MKEMPKNEQPNERPKAPEVKVSSGESQSLDTKRRRETMDAVNLIVGDMESYDQENTNLWSMKKQEWAPLLTSALKEPKGSVEEEDPARTEVLSHLVFAAFNREMPDADETMDPEILEKNRDKKAAATKTLKAVFDRYPDTLITPKELLGADFPNMLKKISSELKNFEGTRGSAALLESLSANMYLDPDAIVFEMDSQLEVISDFLRDIAVSDTVAANSGKYENNDPWNAEEDENHKQEAAKILPILKAMKRVRDAMSNKYFGNVVSADDVVQINHQKSLLNKKEAAENIAKTGGVNKKEAMQAKEKLTPEQIMLKKAADELLEDDKEREVGEMADNQKKSFRFGFSVNKTFLEALKNTTPENTSSERENSDFLINIVQKIEALTKGALDGTLKLSDREKMHLSQSINKKIDAQNLMAYRVLKEDVVPRLGDEWGIEIKKESERIEDVQMNIKKLGMSIIATPSKEQGFFNFVRDLQKKIEKIKKGNE